ncbi:MAG TPA: efflux RND transporter permease subunit, partial [Opitutaceae bacterium]
HKLSSFQYMDIVRQRMRRQTPELSAYFQTGGLVDAVLNLGLPAPIDIQVDSTDMEVGHAVAMDIARKARALSEVNDVLVPQDVDYPSLQVSIDRKRAGELGLSEKEIVDNMITALTSNAMIAPNYWVDPKSGNDYLLTVQYFEGRAKNLSDLASIPLRGTGVSKPTYLDAVTRIRHINAPTEVDHYQLRRVTDIYVSPKNEDLSRVMGKLQAIIAATSHPTNVRINVRGSVQAMQSSFKSFGLGLILSTLLVYLILVAQFESFFDPFVILLAVPTGLTGVILILWLTGTTLNIMSLMGVVMMVGIVASNSILIVEFTRQLRAQGRPLREAVALACRVRLRPVLMTSLATLIGLIPMALALGEGSEAYAPLARAIIGGLAVSVVLTVYIVPAAYYLYHRRREPSGPPAGGAPVAR